QTSGSIRQRGCQMLLAPPRRDFQRRLFPSHHVGRQESQGGLIFEIDLDQATAMRSGRAGRAALGRATPGCRFPPREDYFRAVFTPQGPIMNRLGFQLLGLGPAMYHGDREEVSARGSKISGADGQGGSPTTSQD